MHIPQCQALRAASLRGGGWWAASLTLGEATEPLSALAFLLSRHADLRPRLHPSLPALRVRRRLGHFLSRADVLRM